MFNYLRRYYIEFMELDAWSKVCLSGSWVTAGGAAILLTTSAITAAEWLQGDEPDEYIKKGLLLGVGTTIGAALFTTGAALESDRQIIEASSKQTEDMWARVKARQKSHCPTCKYFNDDCAMYCSIHPTSACTPEMEYCPDYESIKEV
ncbi:MAG: hypothetical protein KME38_28810 [Spirirestis rafaelensis WJT71-NPBG6]|jgi:hypothetical protein|nr:hypothetical protein [Spirirestis rafaelensis WJT71-NPBG6]